MARCWYIDKSDIVTDFSPARLKAARVRREMSPRLLAEAIGADAAWLMDWEAGRLPVRRDTLRKLCFMLGVEQVCLRDPPLGDGAGV